MVNLSKFKIFKYSYKFSNNDFETMLWDKMNEYERKWAIRFTLEGVNDSGEKETGGSWDLMLIEPKLKEKIDEVLDKYGINFVDEDLTEKLDKDSGIFSETFLEKLDSFLGQELNVDGILDKIID